MRLPFVSAASYDWAIRHSERLADEVERERERGDLLFRAWQEETFRVQVMMEKIVDMKKQNFVVDTPITSTPLSVDEADEYTVEEDEAKRRAMLKQRLG